MTDRPSLDIGALNETLNELDTKDADHFELMWYKTKASGMQAVVWPMTIRSDKQGNMSNLAGDIYVYSPKVH